MKRMKNSASLTKVIEKIEHIILETANSNVSSIELEVVKESHDPYNRNPYNKTHHKNIDIVPWFKNFHK